MLCALACRREPALLDEVPAGLWGGDHAALAVSAEGAEAEFDCGHGRTSSPLRLDGRGAFRVDGLYVPEGGPVRESPPSFPAVFAGETDGRRLAFTVTLTDSGQSLGVFRVVLGQSPRLLKCL